MTLIADTLRRHLNFDCELVFVEYAATWDLKETGEWEITSQTVTGFLGDPSGTVPFFKGDDPTNWSGYSNSKIDRLIAEIDEELDPEKRREKVQEIERQILTDLPILPGLFWIIFPANYPYVKNYRQTWNSYGPNAKFEDVWMEK